MARVHGHSVDRASQTQALTTAYGATITIADGSLDISITMDDSAIGFTVQDQGDSGEEAVPAGSSWVAGNGDHPINADLLIKIKSASGTPTAIIRSHTYKAF
jgi:hypothetical protein